jgi:3-hydroxy-3-methylglutaryl CoA synthase
MGSVQELIFGDAGAAILVSDKGVIAEFKGFFSITRDFVDHVRGANSRFDRQWEERWIRDLGYSRFIPEAIKGLCGKYGLAPADFAKVIYPCYFGAARKSINDQLGLSSENVQDDMQATVGDTGAAHSILMPAKALEEANAGTSSSL